MEKTLAVSSVLIAWNEKRKSAAQASALSFLSGSSTKDGGDGGGVCGGGGYGGGGGEGVLSRCTARTP